MKVWSELSILDGLVMRGARIVIPQAEFERDIGNICKWLVELGNDGHVRAPGIKNRLRSDVWFPGMDSLVEKMNKTCWGCTVNRVTRQRPTQTHHSP